MGKGRLKKGGAAPKWARGDRQTNFGTLNFGCEHPVDDLGYLFHKLCALAATANPSNPFPIPAALKSILSRQSNPYTRIFDAG